MGTLIRCSEYDGECELIGNIGALCPYVDNPNCLEIGDVVIDEEEEARAKLELDLIFKTVGLDPPKPKVCADFEDCDDGCPGDGNDPVCDKMCEDEAWQDHVPEVDPLAVLENRAKEADVMEGQLTLLTAEVAELKSAIEDYDNLADVAADVINELTDRVKEQEELTKSAQTAACDMLATICRIIERRS